MSRVILAAESLRPRPAQQRFTDHTATTFLQACGYTIENV